MIVIITYCVATEFVRCCYVLRSYALKETLTCLFSFGMHCWHSVAFAHIELSQIEHSNVNLKRSFFDVRVIVISTFIAGGL